MLEDKYRYGFNGQQKDNEIAGVGNWTNAKYWGYGTREAVRKNPDPITNPSISPYAVLDGNPIKNNDPLGNQPDPIGQAKRAFNAIISLYNAARVVAGVTATVAEKVIKYTTPAQRQSAQVTAEFLTGLGPERREFGPNDPITQSIARSHLTQVAKQEFFKYNVGALSTGALTGDFSGVKSLENKHMSFGLTGLFDKSGIPQEWGNSAAEMVGSANYTISLSADHKFLNFHVDDVKGRYSLLYHGIIPGTKEAATDQPRRKGITPLGNTYQSYEWSEPILPQPTSKK